jgi:hypothetical protein
LIIGSIPHNRSGIIKPISRSVGVEIHDRLIGEGRTCKGERGHKARGEEGRTCDVDRREGEKM